MFREFNWTLYEIPLADGQSFLWLPYKFMVPPDTPARWHQRRSFDLRWNPAELRLGKSRETLRLEMEQPDLYERVELWLSLYRDAAWLESELGLTAEEVEAERTRLRLLARSRRAEKRAAARG